MNIADKMERESRLLANLVSWMESHGEVLSDRSRSNHYVGVRIRTGMEGCIPRWILTG